MVLCIFNKMFHIDWHCVANSSPKLALSKGSKMVN